MSNMYRLKFSCLDYACVENFTYMYVLFNGLEFCKVHMYVALKMVIKIVIKICINKSYSTIDHPRLDPLFLRKIISS